MSLSDEEKRRFVEALRRDPAFREEVRNLVLPAELLTLPSLVAENSRQIGELQVAVSELQVAVSELQVAVAGLQVAVSELQVAVAGLQASFAGLREEVAANGRRIDELHSDFRGLRGEFEDLRSDFRGLRGEFDDLRSDMNRKIDDLRTEVGRLSQIVGGTVEEDAASVVRTVLEGRGARLEADPHGVAFNGELDVLATAVEDSGSTLSVLVEAKVRLRPADVRKFAVAYPSLVERLGLRGDHVGYVYGLRVYAGAEEAAREVGLGVLCPDGERLAPARRVA
ncbi:MAG: hypothetical protein ACP5P1_14595 [Acidimicrobiales bacterium]